MGECLRKIDLKYFILSAILFFIGVYISEYSFHSRVNEYAHRTSSQKSSTLVAQRDDIFKIGKQLFGNAATIAITNLIVVTVISVGGLITGSLTTVTGLIWNGYFLENTILKAYYAKVPFHDILISLCFHGPIELFAILWAGSIGFRGIRVTANFLANKKNNLEQVVTLTEIGFIIALILIAATIESIVITTLGEA